MKPSFLLLTAVLKAAADCYEITVQLGVNVTLTGPDSSDITSVTVTNSGNGRYIYYCIDGHAIRPNQQDPSFVGRVEGTACPLKPGIVSVAVRHVTREDSGEYKWIWRNSTGTFSSTVYLKVTDGGAADGSNTFGNPTPGNTPSGITPLVGAIVGGIVVLIMVMIIILYLSGSIFSWRIPSRLSDQKNSELSGTYSEVKQQ